MTIKELKVRYLHIAYFHRMVEVQLRTIYIDVIRHVLWKS